MSELYIVSLGVNLEGHPKDLAKDIISLYSKRFYRKMTLLNKEDMAALLKRALEAGYLYMPLSNSGLDDLRIKNYKALNKGATPSLTIRDITPIEVTEGDQSLVIYINYDYTMTLSMLPGLKNSWLGSSAPLEYSTEDTLGSLLSRVPFLMKVLHHDTLRRILATHGSDKLLGELGIHSAESEHSLSPDSQLIGHQYNRYEDDEEYCDDCDENPYECGC